MIVTFSLNATEPRTWCPSGRRWSAASDQQAPWAAEHRDGADVAGLQPAGDGGCGAHGHQPPLLDGLAPKDEVDRDAGLGSSLDPTGIDVHEHLADRAAAGRGCHGRDGEVRRSPAPAQRPYHGRGAACVSPGGDTRGRNECAALLRLRLQDEYRQSFPRRGA